MCVLRYLYHTFPSGKSSYTSLEVSSFLGIEEFLFLPPSLQDLALEFCCSSGFFQKRNPVSFLNSQSPCRVGLNFSNTEEYLVVKGSILEMKKLRPKEVTDEMGASHYKAGDTFKKKRF